ncbi:MAG: sulfotransferase domain-containing protein, partial [Colwellia sp.]
KIPICVVRYEDLLADPQQHFATALEFAQIKTDTHSLKQAIDNTSFSKLKQQEASSRFAETPRDNDQFFRKGKAGGWRNYLTPCQVEQIIEVHGTVMHSLGYLDKDNKPIF